MHISVYWLHVFYYINLGTLAWDLMKEKTQLSLDTLRKLLCEEDATG